MEMAIVGAAVGIVSGGVGLLLGVHIGRTGARAATVERARVAAAVVQKLQGGADSSRGRGLDEVMTKLSTVRRASDDHKAELANAVSRLEKRLQAERKGNTPAPPRRRAVPPPPPPSDSPTRIFRKSNGAVVPSLGVYSGEDPETAKTKVYRVGELEALSGSPCGT